MTVVTTDAGPIVTTAWLHERAEERRKAWAEHAKRHWAAKYVGIPFVELGATMDGCNCWGLVHLVLAKECGIDVPTYGEISAADLVAAARAMRRDSCVAPWQNVTEPQSFDVVLMYAMAKELRVVGHAGIMSSPTHILHVEKATHVVNVPITHWRIRNRIVGFYRHRELERAP